MKASLRFLGTGASGGTPGRGRSRRLESSVLVVNGASILIRRLPSLNLVLVRGGSRDDGLSARRVRVLDVAPYLANGLDQAALREASAGLVARIAEVQWTTRTGEWGPTKPAGHIGLLIIDGLILREVRLLETASAEVLGEGDLLRPWDTDGPAALPFGGDLNWTVLSPVRLVVLDAAFLRQASRWPDLVAALVARAVVRAKSLALHEAITNLKHVETRLLVQFWHLAERWGRVGRDRISLDVPLTHEMLAKLVGATRPSVTTALRRLSERGLLVRDVHGVWLLSRDIPGVLAPVCS